MYTYFSNSPSADVTDATAVTVTADVSMLDSGAEKDSVMLTAGTGTHTISEGNTNANGEYTITVTATDAAGNTGMGTVMVMLDNTRSYTSMIPDGVSLFSVPLIRYERHATPVSDSGVVAWVS